MLVETGIVSTSRRPGDSRRRSRGWIWPTCAATTTTAPAKICSFTSIGCSPRECGRRERRATPHRAQPQRHRHDDLPDAAASGGPRRARRDAAAAPLAAGGGRTDTWTRCFPRTRTRSPRSRRQSRTTCSRWSKNSSAARRGAAAAFDRTNRNPLGACAITGTGFPDRPATHERTPRLRRPDGQHLRQHRDGRLPARIGGGGVDRGHRRRAFRSGHVALVHGRGRAICACRTGSCRSAASCRRSGIPSRSSTRGRFSREAWPSWPLSRPRCTTRPSATSSTPRTTSSRSSRRRSRTRHAASPSWPRPWPRPPSMRRACALRAADGIVTVTELADALARDHGLSFRGGARRRAAGRAQPGATTPSAPIAPIVARAHRGTRRASAVRAVGGGAGRAC